jgi:hypothetical protein
LKLAQRLTLSQRQVNGDWGVARVLVVEDKEFAARTQQLMYAAERSDQFGPSFEVEDLVEHLNGYDEVEVAWLERNLRCFSLNGQNVRFQPGTPQFSKEFMGSVKSYDHRRGELLRQSEGKGANPAA